MLDQEQIDQQLTILAAHRQTLGVLLAQQATLGAAYAPPGVANGLAEARAAIARIKATLRAAGVMVEDLPDDHAAPALLPLPAALRGPSAALAGDTIAGDKLMSGQALGDKYGIDTAHIYLPPPPAPDLLAAAQARLAEMPLDAIPDVGPLPTPHRMSLSRNPMFVGRDDDLRSLARALKGEQSVAAIGQAIAATGMGGIGKTNLATEFVHRYGRYFAGGVFWLSFADANTIPAEVAACGMSGLVTHPGWGDLPLDQQVTLVRRMWEEPVPRLLVFDNCEDEDLVRQWRPATGGCRVLITSRRGRWSTALGVAALALDTLPRPESVALLRRHRPDLAGEDPAIDAIAAELGDLPLALHLAGSFLETYRDDERIGDPAAFLAELRGQAILGHEALEGIDTTYSPTNHQLHVARTFSLSYDRLDPGDPVDQIARALLACAACLAPGEPIPRDLLLAIAEADDADPAERRSIARAIERLRAVGLMEAAGEHAVRMHRLVRWFVERVGDMDAARDHVEQVVIREANRHYKNPEISVILAAQAHLRAVVDAAIQARREDAVWLCNEVGLCLNTIGALSAARQLFESALTILDAQGDGQTEERSATLQNLAGVLWDQGDYRQAQVY